MANESVRVREHQDITQFRKFGHSSRILHGRLHILHGRAHMYGTGSYYCNDYGTVVYRQDFSLSIKLYIKLVFGEIIGAQSQTGQFYSHFPNL
jgi:hypothetical protein